MENACKIKSALDKMFPATSPISPVDPVLATTSKPIAQMEPQPASAFLRPYNDVNARARGRERGGHEEDGSGRCPRPPLYPACSLLLHDVFAAPPRPILPSLPALPPHLVFPSIPSISRSRTLLSNSLLSSFPSSFDVT